MLKNSSEVFCSSLVSGLTQSTAGAAGGAGVPRNFDSGWTLYWSWILMTLSMSAGLNSWVRKTARLNSVSDWITSLMPSGFSPFQSARRSGNCRHGCRWCDCRRRRS